jgi:ectoine hydroxylase-related dioxygenase (phytanoyl-CoA dioxygenase family)
MEDPGVFTVDQLDELSRFFETYGYATLRGAVSDTELLSVEEELVEAQQAVASGALGDRFGSVTLDEPDAMIDGRPFAHYVYFATQASPRADALVHSEPVLGAVGRLLGPEAWLLDYEVFGVVYQDARPEPGSGYSRIGWHTDHQSGPHLAIWPGVAFTVHFDPTSPANGFLRVLPGSHRGGTEGIPLGFERVPGEIGVYQERGDVLFHHADLWHSAARGTAEGEPAIRRHLRGSWHAGQKLDVGHGTDDFVRNALR